MNLPQNVREYYLKHFNKLPQDKQFHFATRLAAWNNDPEAIKKLSILKSYVLPEEPINMSMVLKSLIYEPPQAKVNAALERAPYFAKYPDLRGLMLALFRVRHLLFVYDIDTRQDLLSIKSLEELRKFGTQLMDDKEAVKVLSTYAINYLYLIERILFDDSGILDPQTFYDLGSEYDTSDPNQILLLIYLYTHCIIGESNFYERGLTQNQPVYHAMLDRLETLITDNYDLINLDNKLEFLVCCRIAQFETALMTKIYAECEKSISPEGTFLIDTVNQAKQSAKTSFSDSEHRNVLYIMSCSPYNPS